MTYPKQAVDNMLNALKAEKRSKDILKDFVKDCETYKETGEVCNRVADPVRQEQAQVYGSMFNPAIKEKTPLTPTGAKEKRLARLLKKKKD